LSPDLPYWIAFARVRGIGTARFKLLQKAFPSLERAWAASGGDLQRAGLDQRTISEVLEARSTIDPDRELGLLDRHDVRAVTWEDPAYPLPLREIPASPPVLFVRGELTAADQLAIGIVGTRQATPNGVRAATAIAGDIARAGITVVSGLALGIDAIAHTAALDAGGRTIAVLASGLDTLYPPRNKGLAARIVEHGALVSDYPLGVGLQPQQFAQRNRIISGLSKGAVMVEGGRKSGAVLTILYAIDQNREAFAVPGSIYWPQSEGTNALIQRGHAKLVTSAADVLEELQLQPGAQLSMDLGQPADPLEAAILRHLAYEAMPLDDLAAALDATAADVGAAITMLELDGRVKHLGGRQYARIR
jgi:DNA processing protein